MNFITKYFFGELKGVRQVLLFRKVVSFLILYRLISAGIHFSFFYSSTHAIYLKPLVLASWKDLFNLLIIYDSSGLRILFLVLSGILAILLFLDRLGFSLRVLLFFLIVNLHNFIYPSLTGGDFLFFQFLFWNIFFFIKPDNKKKWLQDFQYLSHHVSFLSIRLQICLAYGIAAYFKCIDPEWLNGTAVSTTLQVDMFSLPFFQNITVSVALFMTYFTLLYQVLFPVTVWIKPIKKYILIIGIVQHLFIALVMGLPWFSAVMITGYIFFLDFNKKS